MIGIPDWSNEPLANLDEIAKRDAEIDAELAELRRNKSYAQMQDGEIVPVYAYRYTGTVDVWTEDSVKA